MLTVLEYKNLADLQSVCDYGEKIRRSHGCAWATPGRTTLAIVRPKDWCDWARIKTLGHEVLHAMGYDHGPTFQQWYNPQATWPMSGKNCQLVPR